MVQNELKRRLPTAFKELFPPGEELAFVSIPYIRRLCVTTLTESEFHSHPTCLLELRRFWAKSKTPSRARSAPCSS